MDPERYLHHLELLRDGDFPDCPDMDLLLPMPGSPVTPAHPEVVPEPPLPAPASPPVSDMDAQHTPDRKPQNQKKSPTTAKRTPENKVKPHELFAPDTPMGGGKKAAAHLSPQTPSDKPRHPSKKVRGFKGAAKSTNATTGEKPVAKEDMSSSDAATCIRIVTRCQGEHYKCIVCVQVPCFFFLT